MKFLKREFILLLLIGLSIIRCTAPEPRQTFPETTAYPTPKRLMILVFDQLRPDLIEKHQLKNFMKLKKEGLSFPNAIVGHLSSVTVVSHPVITTGLFPKHLPWLDEFFLDDEGKLGPKGELHSALDLKLDQYRTLLQSTSSVSLLSRIAEPLNSSHTYTLGQKSYAVMGFAAPLNGTVITLGDKMSSPKGWRGPYGFKVPSFFLEPFLGRFYLDCNSTYGSEESLYPIDGNRFVQGTDPSHSGGDSWVSDGVTKIIENDPEWKAIFATFGSIDKMLHIFAEHEKPTQKKWAIENKLTLKDTLQRADAALGNILRVLESRGQLEETLIIITADHGGQANAKFHGLTKLGLGTNYLFFARAMNKENIELPKSLAPILKTKRIKAISHDSGLRIWTRSANRKELSELAREVSHLPGVAEVYTLVKTDSHYHYLRTFRSNQLQGRELTWAEKHHLDLLETMANKSAPDLVALLFDGEGYGFLGDHGGAQEWVQRIPLIIRSPNLRTEHKGQAIGQEVRLVDINPIASYLMKLPIPAGLDGSFRSVEGYTY